MDPEPLRSMIHALMPAAIEDLGELIRHPSVAFSGFPPEPVFRMANATLDLLQAYGLPNARLLPIPDGYPAVYGEIRPPPGAPTVLFYAHYDVQPAPREQGWETDPWTPLVRDGRLCGRGAADNKCGILTHAATIRAFGSRPPVGVKVLIEGEEESTDSLARFVAENPNLVACDAFVIADMGNLTAGEPALTATLRGEAGSTITVRTLDHAVHSGEFGGPAPDALTALCRILASLHDENGDVAVPALTNHLWEGAGFPEELYRRTAGLLDGVDLIGSGTITSRLWSGPAIDVVGIDAPSVQDASNILVPSARARISMRTAPEADADRELEHLMEHLRRSAPWGVQVEVEKFRASRGFVCPRGGPVHMAAKWAMETAYGRPVQEIGGGGSIPLLHTLRQAVPDAEFVLWGSEDLARSRIHGPNESLDLGDFERTILAPCLLLLRLGRSDRGCREENHEPPAGANRRPP
ncbi:MAG: M20/M25/M40 family metallo-hydrolase [Methanomicrobiales archaeon]|nr:M20/M25/M40 family metallo-hydrolase [Methanomicrobiales archaeon]MDI6875455.1 M20/M25/M40 family metallo-hydrolase [Methanomicrobiales archaeon]